METKTLRIQKFTSGRFAKVGKRPAVRYYFRIRAANNEIIASSEAYETARARNKTAKLLAESKIEIEVEPED